MSDKLNEEPDIIDLDETGDIKIPDGLPKEVTMDTQLLTDVSAEISLSMEDTQPLADIKALAEAIEKTQVPIDAAEGETKVISNPDLADTMVILDLDKTSELSGLLEDLPPVEELADEAAEPAAEDADYDDEYGDEEYDEDLDDEYEEEEYDEDPDEEFDEADEEYEDDESGDEYEDEESDEEYDDDETGEEYDDDESDEEYDDDEYDDEEYAESDDGAVDEYDGSGDGPVDEEYDGAVNTEYDDAADEGAAAVEDAAAAADTPENAGPGEAAAMTEEGFADTAADGMPEGGETAAAAGEKESETDARLFETGEIMSLDEARNTGKDSNPAAAIKKNPANMIVLAAAAVILLALCVAIGVKSYRNRSVVENKPYMYDVGERLARIGTAGQSGLIAMADAGAGNSVIPEDEDTEDNEDSKDPAALTYVKLSFTSVAKDIKLKFINTQTERLITDVEFEVVLTNAAGEKLRLVDEDQDGIIYKKEVAGGEYKLSVADKSGYEFSSVPGSVTVKENISYQKIDIKEEIKKENEVNAAAEDTGNAKEPEEGPPPTPTTGDTVEWVESSKTPKEGTGGYKPVEKDDIPEPSYTEATASNAGANAYLAAYAPFLLTGSEICASEDPTPGNTPTPIPTKGAEPTPKDDGDDDEEDPTPTKDPDATPTVTPGDNEDPTPTGKDQKNPKKDKTTKLKDKNGNQLYVKDGDEYREAVYADYYKAEAFYAESEVEYIYTGWQTFDEKTYYFDKNGNKVTGDQIIKGVKYHFDENGVLDGTGNNGNNGGGNGGNSGNTGKGNLGIDVSKWNGAIDWGAVAASGVKFAIIRCGYRGSSTGVLVEDPTFRANIQGAQAAGIKVGLYFFTQAVNEVEAVEEASMCMSLAQGYSISYPIFIDVEFTVNRNGRADGLDRATRSAVARAFCETINSGGYAGGVYSSKSWFGYSLDMSVIGGYKIWLAHYTSQTDYGGHYDLWQYSSKGSISGIKGNVDLNYSYLGY